MTNEFTREDRYIVFKISDVVEHLTTTEALHLARLYEIQRVGRKEAGKAELECVVVESDWPEYGPTWRAIEDRVTGAQPAPSVPEGWKLVPIEPQPTALLVAAANLVAQMEIVSRVGFIDTPDDKDSCAAFCVAEGTWLELMSCVESLASALVAAPKPEVK